MIYYNLFKYYQVAHLTQLSVVYSRYAKPDWVHMERMATPGRTLDHLLCSTPKYRPPILAPTLSYSVALWDRLRSNTPLVSSFRPLAHLF